VRCFVNSSNVRLQPVLLPDAMGGGHRQTDLHGQPPHPPVGRGPGLAQHAGLATMLKARCPQGPPSSYMGAPAVRAARSTVRAADQGFTVCHARYHLDTPICRYKVFDQGQPDAKAFAMRVPGRRPNKFAEHRRSDRPWFASKASPPARRAENSNERGAVVGRRSRLHKRSLHWHRHWSRRERCRSGLPQ